MVADSEREIGKDWETQYRNWASPDGAVELLRAIQEKRAGLSAENQTRIMKYLIETTRGVKRLKGSLPPTAVVAHKPGTSGSRNGVFAATNDIGIVTLPNGRHLLIAVFVSDSPASVEVREAVIAKIARAAWDAWGE
jgi:beta-lactamase class A